MTSSCDVRALCRSIFRLNSPIFNLFSLTFKKWVKTKISYTLMDPSGIVRVVIVEWGSFNSPLSGSRCSRKRAGVRIVILEIRGSGFIQLLDDVKRNTAWILFRWQTISNGFEEKLAVYMIKSSCKIYKTDIQLLFRYWGYFLELFHHVYAIIAADSASETKLCSL